MSQNASDEPRCFVDILQLCYILQKLLAICHCMCAVSVMSVCVQLSYSMFLIKRMWKG